MPTAHGQHLQLTFDAPPTLQIAGNLSCRQAMPVGQWIKADEGFKSRLDQVAFRRYPIDRIRAVAHSTRTPALPVTYA
ncbi:MAG: hypothetical protein R3F37_21965 [Candidatus Competibacteraceae bacterium]